MVNNNNKILEHLINENLYKFLQSITSETLKENCENLRLSDEQLEFLEFLHPIARSKSESEFLMALELQRKNNPKIYPLEIDPDQLHLSSSEPYRNLLKGKRVALVGPSASILGEGRGGLIESFDYVVRMNFQWPIAENLVVDLGQRMDILYHCCNGDFPIKKILCKEFSMTKFVCYERNIDSRVLRRYCNDHNIKSLDITNVYSLLREKLNAAANTGTVAITHLLQFDLAQLFITGISFFREPYYPGYLGDGAKSSNWDDGKSPERIHEHIITPQIKHCRELISADSRVLLDRKLENIVHDQ